MMIRLVGFGLALVPASLALGDLNTETYPHPALPDPSNWPRVLIGAILAWILFSAFAGTILYEIRRRRQAANSQTPPPSGEPER
jgi:hypothetical protein